jgi:hypothetical protein
MRTRHPLLLLLPLLIACADEPETDDDESGGTEYTPASDYGEVCFNLSLELVANSRDCSRDHDGADYTCAATIDGMTVTATTTYTPGDDPNDACGGPRIASCGLTLEEGPHVFVFAGQSYDVDVQPGAAVCVPSGGAFDTGE